jgi:hypothetical protein
MAVLRWHANDLTLTNLPPQGVSRRAALEGLFDVRWQDDKAPAEQLASFVIAHGNAWPRSIIRLRIARLCPSLI